MFLIYHLHCYCNTSLMVLDLFNPDWLMVLFSVMSEIMETAQTLKYFFHLSGVKNHQSYPRVAVLSNLKKCLSVLSFNTAEQFKPN